MPTSLSHVNNIGGRRGIIVKYNTLPLYMASRMYVVALYKICFVFFIHSKTHNTVML